MSEDTATDGSASEELAAAESLPGLSELAPRAEPPARPKKGRGHWWEDSKTMSPDERRFWRRYEGETTITKRREDRWRITKALEELRAMGLEDPEPTFPLHALVESTHPDRRVPSGEDLLEDCVSVRPTLAPVFVLRMATTGASRTGERSFSLPAVEESVRRFLAFCPTELLLTKGNLEAGTVGVPARTAALGKLLEHFHARPGGPLELKQLAQDSPCRIVLTPGTGISQRISVKVCTIGQEAGPFAKGTALCAWPEKTTVRRPPLRPDEAVELLAECRRAEVAIEDPDEIAEGLEALVRGSVAVHEVRGMPGLCELAEGQASGDPLVRRRLSAAAGVRVARAREEKGDRIAVAESVADVAAMEEASDRLDERLFEPQRRVVAAQLATTYGMVNAGMVGTGKTACSMRAARAKALAGSGYRGLVVVQAALREQWVEEVTGVGLDEALAGKRGEGFFPEAEICVPEGMKIARELVRFEHATGERPGLIFITYEQARVALRDLMLLTYDELYVDEADMLCNTSQLERALWKLRSCAAVGVALSGTPIGRKLAELDRIVAWSREDERARREARVGRTYEGLDTLSFDRLQAAFGPVVQRVTRAEMREFMPEVGEVETLRVSPGAALRELLDALDKEIARLFGEVLARLKAAEKAGSALAAEARRELASIRGIMLGGVTVARMAKDPESLRGSSAKVAQLVEANGLLEAAIKEGSPSRQVVAQTIADAARGGEQVLCFAEYTSHLELLRSELAEVHDVEAGMFAGGAWKTERERTKARFRAGDLGVVLIGPVGQKGQNVQPAAEEAIALHYDLPWEPRRFEQRVGRAARPGSGADEIAVLVPILRDSIEEHVAEILLPRSARAIGALSRDREAEPLAVQLEAVARELASDEEASTQIAVCERIFRAHGSGALAAAA